LLKLSTENVSKHDHFGLWNNCNLVLLLLLFEENEHAIKIGLTSDRIETTVHSRLRGARIYNDDLLAHGYLKLTVNIGSAFNVGFYFQKWMVDNQWMVAIDANEKLPLNASGFAITWRNSSTGYHGSQGSNFILSTIAEMADKFIDEYLRVNASAC